MKFLCTPAGHPAVARHADGAPRVLLFGRSIQSGVITTGSRVVQKMDELRLGPAARAWDLLAIALAANAADQAASRARSPDGWTREMELHVAVQDAPFWRSKQADIERALRFLTTDIWTVRFLEGGAAAPEVKSLFAPTEDCVTLLSGGLDSLAGTIDLAARGRKPLAVSQVAAGDKGHQTEFAGRIGGGLYHLQMNHNARGWVGGERSQRARSLVFLAYGVLAATSVRLYRQGKSVTLYVPENGFISINPPLTPERLGSLSTRTTHPVFMNAVQALLQGAGLNVRIENPFQFDTKGEALRRCKNQNLLRELASSSTSCGRFARNAFKHCGRCVPCLIRRAAFRRWGQPDGTSYKFKNLSKQDRRHAFFDDVRSMQIAIEGARAQGADRWLGQSLSAAPGNDREDYVGVVERGLREMGAFLKAQGLR